jgi:hypothetical protein
LTYDAENVRLSPAAFWTSMELFVQYSSLKVCPKTAASSPSCHVAGGNALTLANIIMPTATLTITVNTRLMLNHTTPVSLRVPIAVLDKYLSERIITFPGFRPPRIRTSFDMEYVTVKYIAGFPLQR